MGHGWNACCGAWERAVITVLCKVLVLNTDQGRAFCAMRAQALG
jgi:hypothetical protein